MNNKRNNASRLYTIITLTKAILAIIIVVAIVALIASISGEEESIVIFISCLLCAIPLYISIIQLGTLIDIHDDVQKISHDLQKMKTADDTRWRILYNIISGNNDDNE